MTDQTRPTRKQLRKFEASIAECEAFVKRHVVDDYSRVHALEWLGEASRWVAKDGEMSEQADESETANAS